MLELEGVLRLLLDVVEDRPQLRRGLDAEILDPLLAELLDLPAVEALRSQVGADNRAIHGVDHQHHRMTLLKETPIAIFGVLEGDLRGLESGQILAEHGDRNGPPPLLHQVEGKVQDPVPGEDAVLGLVLGLREGHFEHAPPEVDEPWITEKFLRPVPQLDLDAPLLLEIVGVALIEGEKAEIHRVHGPDEVVPVLDDLGQQFS